MFPRTPRCPASTRSCPTSSTSPSAAVTCAASCSRTATRTTSARCLSRSQAAPAPVYGSRLTLGFVRRRLRERGVTADLRLLTPGQPVELGPFRVHPIRVAHSVLDSLALAIETPAGVVLASGDFKIDRHGAPERAHRRRRAVRLGRARRAGAALGQHQRRAARAHRRRGRRDPRVRGGLRAHAAGACSSPASRPRSRASSASRTLAVAPGATIGVRRPPHGGQHRRGAASSALLRIPAAALDRVRASCRERRRRAWPCSSPAARASRSPRCRMISVGEHRDVAVGPGDTVVFSARADPGQRARGLARDQQPLPPRLRRACTPARPASTSPATAARTSSSS